MTLNLFRSSPGAGIRPLALTLRTGRIDMRVLLADDEPKVRSALRLLLEQEPDLRVVGEAGDAQSMLDSLSICQPDLLLLDWGLPGFPAVEQIARLRASNPNMRVVVLSARLDARLAALEAGADLFISKCDPPNRFLASLRSLISR